VNKDSSNFSQNMLSGFADDTAENWNCLLSDLADDTAENWNWRHWG
jgi:hypothetical protein